MQTTQSTQFKIGQQIRMTYINGVTTEGTIAEIKSDRVRAIPLGQNDDGIGFGFAFRAINRVVTVQII